MSTGLIEVTDVKVRPNTKWAGKGPSHFATVCFSVGDVTLRVNNCTVWQKKDGSGAFAKFPGESREWNGKMTDFATVSFINDDKDVFFAQTGKVMDAVVKASEGMAYGEEAANMPPVKRAPTGMDDDLPF